MRAAAWLLLCACVTTAPAPTPVEAPVADVHQKQRETLVAFVAATEARRFDDAWALLARPLRDRYSAVRLAHDFDAEPLAAARIAQIKRQLDQPFLDATTFRWAEGKALKLTLEPEGWRIASLE